jgi:hypothetical protein
LAGGEYKGRKLNIIKEDSEMKADAGLTKTRNCVKK